MFDIRQNKSYHDNLQRDQVYPHNVKKWIQGEVDSQIVSVLILYNVKQNKNTSRIKHDHDNNNNNNSNNNDDYILLLLLLLLLFYYPYLACDWDRRPRMNGCDIK